jgi:hypothetical protein
MAAIPHHHWHSFSELTGRLRWPLHPLQCLASAILESEATLSETKLSMAGYTTSGADYAGFSKKTGEYTACGIRFYLVGIISGLACRRITGRICGYSTNAGFLNA